MRNPFLSRVALELRRGRPPFPADQLVTTQREVVSGRPFLRLWFMSPGCTHDRRGHCTMCNYGVGIPVSWDAVVRAVEQALESLGGIGGTLLLSPSGSMFDEREVPAEVRRALFALAADTAFDRVLTESRPESVTADVVAETVEMLCGKQFALELGLESSDPWILRWCVNKGLDLSRLPGALAVAADLGVPATLNVSLGTAFLSSVEAIEDAVATTRWGLTAGASDVVVFPLLVRRWTVLAHLHLHGRHHPPSLWSLVEVLRRLGPDLVQRVSIAWYRDYAELDGGAAASMAVLARPTTCPVCENHVLSRLDEYRASQSFEVIEDLVQFRCACREIWSAELAAAETRPLTERVPAEYEDLGREVLGDAWWQRHGADVLAGVPQRCGSILAGR